MWLVEQLVQEFHIIGRFLQTVYLLQAFQQLLDRVIHPSALNTTTFYRRVTTAGSGTASTCVGESSIIEIKVFDLNAGALDPSLNMAYCYGVDPPSIVSSITGGIPDDASTSMGTLTYQWEQSTNGAAWTNHFSYKC